MLFVYVFNIREAFSPCVLVQKHTHLKCTIRDSLMVKRCSSERGLVNFVNLIQKRPWRAGVA